MGITEIWTIIAIVLKLCGVGAFASWDFIALPWHWSCLCIEMWSLILYALILVLIMFKAILSSKMWYLILYALILVLIMFKAILSSK